MCRPKGRMVYSQGADTPMDSVVTTATAVGQWSKPLKRVWSMVKARSEIRSTQVTVRNIWTRMQEQHFAACRSSAFR